MRARGGKRGGGKQNGGGVLVAAVGRQGEGDGGLTLGEEGEQTVPHHHRCPRVERQPRFLRRLGGGEEYEKSGSLSRVCLPACLVCLSDE